MKHAEFVHLHVHTQYSLLDGAIRLDDLMHKAKEYHMPAITMTDHGNMFGTIDFYEKAAKTASSPSSAAKCIWRRAAVSTRTPPAARAPTTISYCWRQDRDGYHNLFKLVSAAYIEGMYYKPRIDKADFTGAP